MDLAFLVHLATQLQMYWPTIFVLVGTFLHKRLDKFPVAQVLIKYASVFPILKLLALELAQAVINQWGPAPPPQEAMQEVWVALQKKPATEILSATPIATPVPVARTPQSLAEAFGIKPKA
jgi:hypothetical protein